MFPRLFPVLKNTSEVRYDRVKRNQRDSPVQHGTVVCSVDAQAMSNVLEVSDTYSNNDSASMNSGS